MRKQRLSRLVRFVPHLALVVSCCCLFLLTIGCNKGGSDQGGGKIKVCYIGLTCEPAIFVAYEKGFFEEEGVDVELVKSDWDSMRDGLGIGNFQATHHLLMYMLKPVENGLDVKITGGIHTGCLRLQAGKNTDIKTVEDVRGKKVGVTVLGSPPHLFASRAMTAQHMQPEKDVEWVVMPADTFALALDQGKVDAVASAEPIGSLLMATDKVNVVCDQAVTPPYCDEFCCVVTLNGRFARENPTAAAKVTRALMKGAKWVSANPTAAAKLAVEKNYISATVEINAQAISALKYEPAVARARRDLVSVARELKDGGFLKDSTDPEELVKQAWLDLDGVTDEWVNSLTVEKVAGGGPAPKLNKAEFAALFENVNCCTGGACLGCCGDLGRGMPPLTGEWARLRPLRLELLERSEGGTELVYRNR
jgi:NitT/TauT family transport system substrate-binding protein